jgi:cytosine/adenosine deaminase-related metal-dependent hydrolase
MTSMHADVADLVIRGARLLTLDELDTEYESADIVINGGKIVALIPAADPHPPAVRVIDGRGMLAMPGLVNAHLHSPGNFMKGAVANMPLELFMLYEVPPLVDKPVSGRFAYVRTLLGVIEMLRQGVTTVHDDCFFVPHVTDDELASVMQGYVDGGIRARVTLDQPNVVEYTKYPFLEELLPPALRTRMENAPGMSESDLLSRYEEHIRLWPSSAWDRVGVSVSCSAPQRVTPSYLQALGDLSRRHNLPYNMHILETRLQRVLGDVNFDGSLIQYADRMGVLGEHTLVIHAIWIDDRDLDVMAKAGCSVAHNPVSNLKIGSGIMPYRRIADRGINVCLGTDESTVDDGIHMWTTVKMTGLIHNVASADYDRWPTTREILGNATAGGARAMRLEGVTGSLSPGMAADLILIDLDDLAFTPLNDLRSQLVYCEPASAVRTTIVAGQVLMHEGQLADVDEVALKAEARALAEELRAYLAECTVGAVELDPHYRAMYQRCLEHPIPMSRWAGPMTP